MNQINIQYYKSRIGEFILGSFDDKLCMLDWRYRRMRTTIDNRLKTALKSDYVHTESDVIENTIEQLEQYLSGDRTEYDLPLLMVGTEFQKKVWNALLAIPYGHTSSYLELAKCVANKNAVRATASANGANAISLIVPCHRVIGSDGSLVGYAGGLPVKKRLLKLEQAHLFQ